MPAKGAIPCACGRLARARATGGQQAVLSAESRQRSAKKVGRGQLTQLTLCCQLVFPAKLHHTSPPIPPLSACAILDWVVTRLAAFASTSPVTSATWRTCTSVCTTWRTRMCMCKCLVSARPRDCRDQSFTARLRPSPRPRFESVIDDLVQEVRRRAPSSAPVAVGKPAHALGGVQPGGVQRSNNTVVTNNSSSNSNFGNTTSLVML